VLTSTGGGLIVVSLSVTLSKLAKNMVLNSRPCIIDANYASLEEAIRTSVWYVGDVPPYFLDTSKNRQNQSGEDSRLHLARRQGVKRKGVVFLNRVRWVGII